VASTTGPLGQIWKGNRSPFGKNTTVSWHGQRRRTRGPVLHQVGHISGIRPGMREKRHENLEKRGKKSDKKGKSSDVIKKKDNQGET